MLSKKMQDAFNDQINAELFSSYLYLAMSAHLEDATMKGMARWMRLQAQEEMEHAMRLYKVLTEYDARIELKAVAEPKKEYKSLLDAFEAALGHEEAVTASINKLFELSQAEKAHAVGVELHWFLTEQVEEEKSARNGVAALKMAGDDKIALMELDRHFGSRKGD